MRKQLSWVESNQQIELENDDEEIDYMEYCKKANDKQITINNLRDETNKKELKSSQKDFKEREAQINKDPSFRWLKMIEANPDYHCKKTIKDASPYYIFNLMNADKKWRRWLKATIKGTGVKMSRYQTNRHHSIKSYC